MTPPRDAPDLIAWAIKLVPGAGALSLGLGISPVGLLVGG